MKNKYVIIGGIFCCLVGIFAYLFGNSNGVFFKENPLGEALEIYTNANKDSFEYKKTLKLIDNLKKEGVKVELNKSKGEKGNLGLYIASLKADIPEVKNKKGINILWVPFIGSDEDFSVFRNFDVVVVKSIASFAHLKAINVRTAFIPDGIDIKKVNAKRNDKAMFLGDNDSFSLSLYLAKNLNIDIFGKNCEHTEHKDKVKASLALNKDVLSYLLVLVDQSDENIYQNVVNSKVIEVLEMGAIPFVRYNPGLYKIFGDSIPMYYNEDDFYVQFNKLLREKEKTTKIAQSIYNASKNWNSKMLALKFIELFEIMKEKRI